MNKNGFVEDIDYMATGDTSIWGEGDPETLELIAKTSFPGLWLNLAAGDGRYNNLLLQKAEKVIASDIHQNALDKLVKNTPEDLKGKLETVTLNLKENFPLSDNSLDGVFCTGALHFFSKEDLKVVFGEMDRILKPGGSLFIDFATDVKRIFPNGDLYIREGETQYTLEEAKAMLKEFLPNYHPAFFQSSVPPEEVSAGAGTYTFSCNFLLVSGQKPS